MNFSIERQHDAIDAAEMMARQEVTVAVNEMLAELKRAENIHPDWPLDPIHQVSIMVGEAGEALQAVLHLIEGRGSLEAVREEIIQTGAMAIRCLINREHGK